MPSAGEFKLLPLALCAGAAFASLAVVAQNWLAFFRGGSPVLLAAPLFAFLAGGMAIYAGLPMRPAWLWAPPAAAFAVDAAGAALVVALLRGSGDK